MNHVRRAVALVGALASTLCFAESPSLHEAAMIVFRPLPERFETPDNPLTPAKIELGRMLFFEKRLSRSHQVACATCHELAHFGTDGQKTSPKGKGRRNAQSVLNAGNHLALFWDGRASTLEAQAKAALVDPSELALPDANVALEVLRAIPGYQPLFAKAFPDQPDPITVDTVAKALAAFERTLVTPSTFDTYLKGNERAFTEAEHQGLLTFMSLGCMVCHKGEGVGGGMFQSLGFAVQVPPEFLVDLGRAEITKKDDDRHRFRVPSLRNVEKTGPYLHDGSIASLDEVVRFMGKYQLGKELTAQEVASVIAFLKTLTGQPPKITAPEPLPAGKNLPAPQPG